MCILPESDILCKIATWLQTLDTSIHNKMSRLSVSTYSHMNKNLHGLKINRKPCISISSGYTRDPRQNMVIKPQELHTLYINTVDLFFRVS